MREDRGPKDKPGAPDEEDNEKKKNEEGGVDDDDEEFPDLYNEKDEDFDDPDEQEF
jgi:hypothetical protein